MTFDEYIENEITKPTADWYDPNGNSSRAVVTRMKKKGLLVAIGWEIPQLINEMKYSVMHDFDGWNTPIGFVFQLLILPLLFPFSPFIRTYTRYKRAVNDYRQEYKNKYRKN
jgi:hypothetical protein